MKDKKFIPFWMERPKIEIIENYAECVRDREVLLERIEKAVEYIYHWSTQRKKFFDKIDRQLNGNPQFYGDIADLLNILKGEEK